MRLERKVNQHPNDEISAKCDIILAQTHKRAAIISESWTVRPRRRLRNNRYTWGVEAFVRT